MQTPSPALRGWCPCSAAAPRRRPPPAPPRRRAARAHTAAAPARRVDRARPCEPTRPCYAADEVIRFTCCGMLVEPIAHVDNRESRTRALRAFKCVLGIVLPLRLPSGPKIIVLGQAYSRPAGSRRRRPAVCQSAAGPSNHTRKPTISCRSPARARAFLDGYHGAQGAPRGRPRRVMGLINLLLLHAPPNRTMQLPGLECRAPTCKTGMCPPRTHHAQTKRRQGSDADQPTARSLLVLLHKLERALLDVRHRSVVAVALLKLEPAAEQKLHLLGRQLQRRRALEQRPHARRVALLHLLRGAARGAGRRAARRGA